MAGSYKTSLNQLVRSSFPLTFNTLTGTSLNVNGRTETDTINCQDYLSATWGCSFQSNPITLAPAVFTVIPLYLLPGEGQGGPYDAGNNEFKFPANGTYLFEFTCNCDQPSTTALYRITISGQAFIEVVPLSLQGAYESPYRLFYYSIVTDYLNQRVRFEATFTNGAASQITNFFISSGQCIQAAAFVT